MAEGGTLTLAALPEAGPDTIEDHVRIAIIDTGPGLDAGGADLSLALARSFTEQSGGHLTIESALRLGTVVSLLLPFHAPQTEPAEA